MAWNEPGGGSGGKDPWGNRNADKGPPDLDEVMRKIQQKIGGIFRKKGGGPHFPGKGEGQNSSFLIIIAVVVFFIWMATGFYKVDAAERGVVFRFGKYIKITEPGLGWHIPFPIETIKRVNVSSVQNVEVGYSSSGKAKIAKPKEALMLTRDENIVDVNLSVQYLIADAREYLTEVQDPESTLRQVVESTLREVIGRSELDIVLTSGRAKISQDVGTLAQEILKEYKTGLIVTSINLQDVQPPKEVQEAFRDVIKAREDKQRLIDEARAYANEVIPRARGDVARQMQDSEGYKAEVVAQSEGDASRFRSILQEYIKAPKVTRERLYIDTMESVMRNTNKILLDVKEGNNMIYLPLDRIIKDIQSEPQKLTRSSSGTTSSSSDVSQIGTGKDGNEREDIRQRRDR